MKTIISSLGELPPMPAVAIEVVRLLQDPNCDAEDLAQAIALDPAVSLKVLKIANSPFYGVPRKVTTIRNAIVILGQKALRNLVLAVSLKSILRKTGETDQLLWRDAFGCALAARLVGKVVDGVDEEEAFLAGLIRHLGKMARQFGRPETYQEVVKMVEAGAGPFSEVEKLYYKYNHGEIGAEILQKWHFPEVFVQVTLHHADMAIDPAKDPQAFKLVAVVSIAEGMCRRIGLGQKRPDVGLNLASLPAVGALGLSAETLTSLESRFRKTINEDLALFLS